MNAEVNRNEFINRILHDNKGTSLTDLFLAKTSYIDELEHYVSRLNEDEQNKNKSMKMHLEKAMFGQFVDMMNNNNIKNRSLNKNDNDNLLLFVDSPYYSIIDEDKNDKVFRELCPKQNKNMRTFLMSKKARIKQSNRLYSANPRSKK